MIDYLRLAFATVVVLLPGVARRARARAALRVGDARLGARARSSSPGRSSSRVHGSIIARRSCVLAAIGVARADRRVDGRRPVLGPARARGPACVAVGVVLGWLLWHVAGVGHRRRALPRGARAQARRPRRPAPAHGRRVQGRRPAPRLRVPALARLPRARREALRPRPGRRRPPRGRRCSRRSRASSPGRRASPSSARRRPALAVLAAPLALFCFAAGHGGSYAVARAARDRGAAAARAGGDRALLRGVGRGAALARRSPPPSARSRSSTRPTRSSLLIPLAGYAVVRARRVARLGARARGRARADRRSRCSGCGRSSTRRSRTTRAPAERAARARSSTATQLVDPRRPHHFRLAPEVVGRSGAVAVAALVLVPLAALRRPRAAGRVRARRARCSCSR